VYDTILEFVELRSFEWCNLRAWNPAGADHLPTWFHRWNWWTSIRL